jgi:hypothetical protein
MPLKVNLAHHPLDALCVVLDLGYVLPQDPAGYVLRGGGAAASQELHEHQGLVDVAHAHAFRDGVAQALVGGGGGWGHGGILAGIPCAGWLAGAGGDGGWHWMGERPQTPCQRQNQLTVVIC